MKSNSRFYFLFADRNTGMYQPHLGSDYLISVLNKCGFSATRILTQEKEMLRDRLLYISREVASSEQCIFGFTCYDANYQMVKQGISSVREMFPGAIIFIGGPAATFNDQTLLESFCDVDICFLGESEESIVEFAKCIKYGADYHNIPNTSYRTNEKVVRIGSNRVLSETEMNSFPSPISCSNYNAEDVLRRYGKISIITSRGCPHRCSFCAFSLQSDHNVRYYSVERVIQEIKIIDEQLAHIQDVSKKKVVIEDDCFTLNRTHFQAITNELIRLKPHLLFECQTRADYLDYDALLQLKAAGFYRVDISLESSNPHTLLRIQKTNSLNSAVEYIRCVSKVIEWCKALSLECYTTLISGLPNDSVENIINTHAFIVENKPTGYFWNYLKIFTGTHMYKEYLANRLQPTDPSIFNPIFSRKLIREYVSSFAINELPKMGDDVASIERREQCKLSLIQYTTGLKFYNSLLIGIDSSFNWRLYAKDLSECLPHDTRVIVFESCENGKVAYSAILSEVLSLALFEENSNEDIYLTLKELSCPLQVPACLNVNHIDEICLCNQPDIRIGIQKLINTEVRHARTIEEAEETMNILEYLMRV